MQLQNLPSIDEQYRDDNGNLFVVIGRGTRGIVVEYFDGKVELISLQDWQNMGNTAQLQIAH